MAENATEPPRTFLLILLIVSMGILTALWMLLAPTGLTGKLWAIGYSVCHQIASHSYTINGVQLPLCVRCTGLFLGALSTLIILSAQARKGAFPKGFHRWILLFFLLAYAVDGLNSTLYEFSSSLSLYTPTHLLRLATGVAMGIALGVLLMSLWNQILWKDVSTAYPLERPLTWLALLAAGGGIIIAVAFLRDTLYYPLALISTAGVMILISMIYSLLWTLGLKKENTLNSLSERLWIFLLGVVSAMVQIAAMDGIRFLITHTWAGIAL